MENNNDLMISVIFRKKIVKLTAKVLKGNHGQLQSAGKELQESLIKNPHSATLALEGWRLMSQKRGQTEKEGKLFRASAETVKKTYRNEMDISAPAESP